MPQNGVCQSTSIWPCLQVDAFRDVLNNASNEVRLLQQHVERQQGGVLVQKG